MDSDTWNHESARSSLSGKSIMILVGLNSRQMQMHTRQPSAGGCSGVLRSHGKHPSLGRHDRIIDGDQVRHVEWKK